MDNFPISSVIETRVVSCAGSNYQVKTVIADTFNGSIDVILLFPTTNYAYVVIGYAVSTNGTDFLFRFEDSGGGILTAKMHVLPQDTYTAFPVREYFIAEKNRKISIRNYGGDDGQVQLWYYERPA